MDIRGAFPLTLRHLGDAIPAGGSPEAFVRAVCEAHAKGNIPHRAARDLVRFESLLAELPPAPAETPGELPPDDAPCRLGAHVRLLVFGAGLPDMLHALRKNAPATPRPARGWVVLHRDPDGEPRESWALREEGWFLERFRDPATPGEAIEDDEERALFARLWREGILMRA